MNRLFKRTTRLNNVTPSPTATALTIGKEKEVRNPEVDKLAQKNNKVVQVRLPPPQQSEDAVSRQLQLG